MELSYKAVGEAGERAHTLPALGLPARSCHQRGVQKPREASGLGGSESLSGVSSPSPSRPQRLSKEVQNALARASNTAEETISALKTVRSFANEEAEAEVYSRKLQQVYKLNRKEAAAYTYYVWGSGVCTPGPQAPRRGRGARRGSLCMGVRLVALDSTLSSFSLVPKEAFPQRTQPPEECPRQAPLGPSGLPVGCQDGEMSCQGGEPPRGQPGPIFLAGPMSPVHTPHSFLAQSQGRGVKCSLGDGEHLATSGRWAHQE